MSTPAAENLVNASPVDVTYVDGKTERLTLARLSIRQLYQFTHLLAGDKVPDLVALCAAKPVEWIDTLSDESFAALSRKSIEINFPRAMTLAKDDPVIAARVAPLLARMQLALVQADSLGPTLSGLSPAPAASGSAPATGSESSTSPQAVSSSSSPSAAA